MHLFFSRARAAMLVCALIASLQPAMRPAFAVAPAGIAARPAQQVTDPSITLTPGSAQTGSPDIALVIGLTGFQTDSIKSVTFGATPLTVVLTVRVIGSRLAPLPGALKSTPPPGPTGSLAALAVIVTASGRAKSVRVSVLCPLPLA